MDSVSPDTESIAAKSKNVSGEAWREFQYVSQNDTNKAALGKSRRLMYSCIKLEAAAILSFQAQFMIATHALTQSETFTLTLTSMLEKGRPRHSCQKWIGCPTLDISPTQERRKEFIPINFRPLLRRNFDF